MRHNARRPVAALILTLSALVIAALVGTPAATATARATLAARNTPGAGARVAAATSTCPDQLMPPPPIDTSEQPAPGQASPTAVPEPSAPIGGALMGNCGVVLPAHAPALPADLGFASWVIEDLDTGAVLAAKDPHARERPASLIKLLLALVVVRELDPDTVIVGTQADADQQGTRVGIGPGGHYTVDQLVHGLLMHSGNDVAHALAMQLGGVSVAVHKMNALAQQLGALDTRAATPSGLDGPGMATSAYDMAVIFRTALANPLIADSIHTSSMPFPGFGDKPGFTLTNDNELLTDYPDDLGGKTGYTDDAQHTYLDAASRDGHRIAVVLMRGTNHLDGMYHNAEELLDYGFALEAAHTAPVGTIVDSNPLANGHAPARTAGPNAPGAATAMSTFGNVGGPLTILAAVMIALVAVLYWRRRRARRRRLARAAVAATRAGTVGPPPTTNATTTTTTTTNNKTTTTTATVNGRTPP